MPGAPYRGQFKGGVPCLNCKCYTTMVTQTTDKHSSLFVCSDSDEENRWSNFFTSVIAQQQLYQFQKSLKVVANNFFSVKNKISCGVEACVAQIRPGAKVIKLFMAVIRSKVECLSLAGLSNLVYFFASKAAAYTSETPFRCSILGQPCPQALE